MASLPEPATLIGKKILFKSKSDKDPTVWRGTVVGATNYDLARGYGDLTSYNAGVLRSDPSVSTDLTTLTYFIIILDNNTTQSAYRAFALEWIADNTFEILEEKVAKKIIVYDYPSNNIQNILTLLKSNGYSAVLG